MLCDNACNIMIYIRMYRNTLQYIVDAILLHFKKFKSAIYQILCIIVLHLFIEALPNPALLGTAFQSQLHIWYT